MDKFKNKYRIPSARLQNWDYANEGTYFITICTHNREHYFGKIEQTPDSSVYEMQLNEMGILAQKFWMEIPIHFPFVELGNFVVMPNHIHGILIIHKNVETLNSEINVVIVETLQSQINDVDVQTLKSQINDIDVQTMQSETNDVDVQTLQCNVSTDTIKNKRMALISPKSGSISTIIRSFKSVVSKNIRLFNADFAWQSRFHDHIIRDAKSFENIQNYIANNPLNWNKDKFYEKT